MPGCASFRTPPFEILRSFCYSRVTRLLSSHNAIGRPHLPTPLERERQLAEVAERRIGASRKRDKKLLRGVARTPLLLDEKQVLPLEEARQTKVKTHGVNGDVNPRARAQVVVGKLGNQGIGVLDGKLIEEAHVAESFHAATIGRRQD